MAAKKKTALEVLLSAVDLHGIKLQPRIVKTKRLVTVELLWPRCSIAKKTSAREVEFRKGQASCQGEEWCRRVLFREEVDGHAGLAVAVSEILDDEWIEKFFRASAKYALRQFGDMAEKYTVGISDVASAPFNALAQLEGAYPGPETAAQGVLDITEAVLPAPGKSVTVEVPLHRPKSSKIIGSLQLELRA